ncbi:hypothetical protein BJY01DRAFT_212520 [Aspergillus pseudoustus]|uniref:Uncharacterized protein n=1 Tax=Aspergillus pseudoustus TaxID=1810923 RepID=A0ABR4K6Q4_9EURO
MRSYMALRDERDMEDANLSTEFTSTSSGPFLSGQNTLLLLLLLLSWPASRGSRPLWLNNHIPQGMQRVSVQDSPRRRNPHLPATPSSSPGCTVGVASKFSSNRTPISTSRQARLHVLDPLRIRGMQPYSLL